MEDAGDEGGDEYVSLGGPPWRSPRNSLNEKLTRIGEGQKVEIRWLRDQKEMRASLVLEKAPPDFENAPKYKSEEVGLTVKDLTLEVRTHYRLKADAPGVVVAKVERGSKAAVSKVVPFEILVSINGAMVRNVAEVKAAVEEAAKAAGEKVLELKLERLGKSRLVRIRM
jgi:serine protease Do